MGNGPLTMPATAPNETCASAALEKNNSTAASCFGRGVCAPDSVLKYAVCACAPKYDARSFCERTVYDVYATRGVAFFAPVIAVHLLFLALFVCDAAADVYHRPARSLRSAPFAAKLLLIAYCLVHIGDMALQTHEAAAGVTLAPAWQGVIDIVAGRSFLIGIAYLAVCVSWLDLLLRAKNLGVPDRTVRGLRVSVIVLCAVLYPLVAALALVVVTSRSAALQAALTLVSAVVALLGNYYCVIMVTVLVVRVLRWLARLEAPDSATVRRVRRRGRFVLAMNALNVVLTVAAAAFQGVAAPLAPLLFARAVFQELIALANLVLMYLFLENHLFGHATPLRDNLRRVLGRTAPPTSSTGTGAPAAGSGPADTSDKTGASGGCADEQSTSSTVAPPLAPVSEATQSSEVSEVSEVSLPPSQ